MPSRRAPASARYAVSTALMWVCAALSSGARLSSHDFFAASSIFSSQALWPTSIPELSTTLGLSGT
ncbi:hypothetical protein AWI43_33275 [Streptomyces sp. WAC04657]|nr:hypothetical protein AWI43_33275 [Streptomyces sp. WAC04657]